MHRLVLCFFLIQTYCRHNSSDNTAPNISENNKQASLSLTDPATFIQDLMQACIEIDDNNKIYKDYSIFAEVFSYHKDLVLKLKDIPVYQFANEFGPNETNTIVFSLLNEIRSLTIQKYKEKDGYEYFLKKIKSEHGSSLKSKIDSYVEITHLDADLNLFPKNPQLNDLNEILKKYPNKLEKSNKNKMIQAFLHIPDNASKEAKTLAALNGSGPILQKIMQLVGSEVDDPELKKTIEDLKTNIPPLSDFYIQRTLKAQNRWKYSDIMRNQPTQMRPEQIYVKKIGSASVGQAVLINYPNDSSQVAKLRRPNIKKIFEGEKNTLNMITPSTSNFSDIMKKAFHSVEGELDFSNEVKNIVELAPAYATAPAYDKNKTIQQIHGLNFGDDIIVMSLAPGKPVADIKDEKLLQAKTEAMEHFYSVWLGRALFGDGNFHADPHTGNIFLDIHQNGNWTITPIDFGSSGKLEAKQQEAAFFFGIGVTAKSSDLVLKSIASLVENYKYSQKLQDGIKKILEENNTQKPVKIVDFIQKEGLKLDAKFILFIRGQAFFQTFFDEVANSKNSNIKLKSTKKLLQPYEDMIKHRVIDWADKGWINSKQIPELKKYEYYKLGKKILGASVAITIPFFAISFIMNDPDENAHENASSVQPESSSGQQ